MRKNQIDFITMGCSKNLVDSEILMRQFELNGYKCVHDSKIHKEKLLSLIHVALSVMQRKKV